MDQTRAEEDPAGQAAAPEPATLPDGTQLTIRLILPDDAAALQRFHGRLSQRSIYRRFFQMVPILSDERAEYFTHLDQVNRHAVVALDPAEEDEIVGVARYDREGDTSGAEYAIVVEDRWQNRGVGWCLTLRLIRDAQANGVERFHAFVLTENRPMLQLFADMGLAATQRRQLDGTVRVDIDIRPPDQTLMREA